MIHTYSHTFKFETPDTNDLNITNKNILSIVEEDAKKHHIHYVQYKYIDDATISFSAVDISLDRLFYLEIANIAIDNQERRKRLFTLLGKRCFGRNDNKLDPYLLDTSLDPKAIFASCKKSTQPILYELINKTTNKFEAHHFVYENNFFVALRQINISQRKTFEKTFLVQMHKDDYTKLSTYVTNELKINFIFNAIGKIYFKSQKTYQKSIVDLEVDPQEILDKTHFYIHNDTTKEHNFFQKDLYKQLQNIHTELEVAYFNILSKGMKLVSAPNDNDVVFMLNSALSKFIFLLEDKPSLQEIVILLKSIKIFAQEKKLSYLLNQNDKDIQDILIYVLETFTSWNAAIESDDLKTFNNATLDLYNALKHFVDIYFEHYYDYKKIEVLEDIKEKKEPSTQESSHGETQGNITSASDFFSDIELDYVVLDELKELDQDIINYFYVEEFNEDIKSASMNFFEGYTKLLNTFFEFKELAYGLSMLNTHLANLDESVDASMLLIFLKSIVDDLIEWKESVFIAQSAEDIHYIDKSFYANISQLEILFSGESAQEEDLEEIEFF